ncbi:prolipoprotein diacylglyceryl transferase [Candidatus Phycosocius bacilliformis]|uniref:prolipoprotein diacylglyceryl transferase n=1 Tax=Candidatus Phycosocius bacilliformis TaxID=1445552 RepID=UPI001788B9D5|nr:prolipoprotein diacylglyceryl transferase family protein [Candidatus Phycosocius bacilliformis]
MAKALWGFEIGGSWGGSAAQVEMGYKLAMTFPVTFSLGALTIPAHLIFEMLSYFLGYHYYRYLRARQGDVLDDEGRIGVIVGGILGAAILSKLLGLLEHPEQLRATQENLAFLVASKTIVGGLIGGLIGVEIAKKVMGISRSTGDLFCLPIILGMMIGRIGCFLQGASDGTWGHPTTWPTGMDGGDGVLRHPMPLYEIGILALIWLLLVQLRSRLTLPEGHLFGLFMSFYLGWRLVADFMKPNSLVMPFGLSAIQIACLLTLTYYMWVFLRPTTRSAANDGNT